MVAAFAAVLCGALLPTSARKSITDVIHRTIDLHPLCVQVIDTPEYQRLRNVGQLAACRWVFPGAVHDRLQHSLGVAHLASSWATHFRRVQPDLGVTDKDVLCVTLAGLLHDLGHGPFSHLWESQFLSAAAMPLESRPPAHEELSCAIFDRMLVRNGIDPSPWLEPSDLEFVKALIRGAPPTPCADPIAMRMGESGVLGSDKRFLYDIVANQRSGFDVDKLDYFERDCHFAGTVKVSFDRPRLMAQARVALVRKDSQRDGDATSPPTLQIAWPVKCVFEVLQVFVTRFSLHYELYQHRVVAAIGLMLRDALLLADTSASFRVYGGSDGTVALRLSECGGARDGGLEGYMQLSDDILALIRSEACRQRATNAGEDVDQKLQAAAALLLRLDRRELYRFAGSVTFDAGYDVPNIANVVDDLIELGDGHLRPEVLRAEIRRVHCGQGPNNPLERIRFFENKAPAAAGEGDARIEAQPLLEARAHPSASYAARLPSAFEERSLRVYVTEDDALPAAEAAFSKWCDGRSLCNVDGVCFIGSATRS